MSKKAWDDPVVTTLFNTVLDATVRESGIQSKKPIYNQRSQVIAYADDGDNG